MAAVEKKLRFKWEGSYLGFLFKLKIEYIFGRNFVSFQDNPYFKAINSVGCLCDNRQRMVIKDFLCPTHSWFLGLEQFFMTRCWPSESILNLPMAVWREIFSKTHDRLILILYAQSHTNNRSKHFPTTFQNIINHCFSWDTEKTDWVLRL